MQPTMDDIYSRMKDDTESKGIEITSKTDIQKFHAGKSILLTGATGFMGKVYVEKILRSCPDIKALYVVVRQKRGVAQEEKMKKYFEHIIFDNLKKCNPDFAKKVVLIKGDLQEEQLGLSEADRQLLIDEVDLIVHSGATTKFDEKISIALKINVLATKYMLDLALECKHAKVFMYVSTAYSHCYNQDIEEKFYDAPADLKTVYDIIAEDSKSEQGISEESLKKYLGKWANTYTFTKSIAEDLVRQYGEKANFACGVYRPSIVSCSYVEPLRGWIGNKNGPAALFIGVGLGALHTSYYDLSPMDLIPVDYSINSLISAVYDSPDRWKREKKPVVYNYGSSTIQPLNLKQMFDYMYEELQVTGTNLMVWLPFMFFVDSKILFWIFHILFHFFPALLADAVLLATGRKARCLSLFWFGTKHLDKAYYFANGNWRIHVPEMMKVNDRMSPADREIFKFDMTNFDWLDFTTWHVRGTRLYILKENVSDVAKSRKHFKRMKMIHYSVVTFFSLLLAYRIFNLLMSAIF